jgi:hemolysin III
MSLSSMPAAFRWNYKRSEIIADGIVHAIGIILGLVGSTLLIVSAERSASLGKTIPFAVYAVGFLAVLGLSAAYNLWPISPTKWLLRRFDHSAIYLLIAATYTPFLAQLKTGLAGLALMIGLWVTAFAGIVMKLLMPGRFDRLSIAVYLLLGWSGVIVYHPFVMALPGSIFALLAAGGVLYSAGLGFHLWEKLRFQNAIWHGCVLVAMCCHYMAVVEFMALTPA